MSHRSLAPTRLALLTAAAALAAASQGCDTLAANLPALAFCGAAASPQQVLQLAEGPSIFVDAIRTLAAEVSGQSQAVGSGLQKGFDVSQQALQALGPYQYDGTGTYTRQAADDRKYRLRFFYGSGVPGKTPDTPIDADLSRVDSYVTTPNFTNGFNLGTAEGPLFPLLASTGLTSGTLNFNDAALRLDVGSVLSTTLKGYGLSLSLGTARSTIGGLVQQLGAKQLALSLADTSMTNAATGFALAITKFDVTAGLNGTADLGGEYGFSVSQGPLTYFGDVTTTAGSPTLSLRCSPAAASEFATVSFAQGAASVHFNTQNLPITLPGLAPLKNP